MRQQMMEDGDLSNFSLSQQESSAKGAMLENATDIKVSLYRLLLLILLIFFFFCIPGGPQKTEQSIHTIFQDFVLINSYFFSPCWIEHLFLIIITPRSSNSVENFLFYE